MNIALEKWIKPNNFNFSLPSKLSGGRRKSFLMNDVSEVANHKYTKITASVMMFREKRTRFPHQERKRMMKTLTESSSGEICRCICRG